MVSVEKEGCRRSIWLMRASWVRKRFLGRRIKGGGLAFSKWRQGYCASVRPVVLVPDGGVEPVELVQWVANDPSVFQIGDEIAGNL